MLRVSERPIDAYRYLALNAREATRVGTWEIEEPTDTRKRNGGGSVRMTYRSRSGNAARARRRFSRRSLSEASSNGDSAV